ncbi:MAG: DMT family transporter [Desulfotomaculaceae bacterium]|nr:DMT family transporter [Desulfotomaculaceae bacterium]
MKRLSPGKPIILLTFLVVIWGLCWPVFKVTLAYTPPLLFGGMRNLLGGLFLVVLAFPRRRLIRWRETWPIYFISALFNSILFYGTQTVGLEYLPSGLFSVIVYLQPVLVGVFAWMWLGESMSALKITGLILGFIGVAAVSTEGLSGNISLLGIILALGCSVSWALGTVYVKKTSSAVDPVWLVAIHCLIGGTVLTGVGLGVENAASIVWNSTYWFGLLYGGILGIAVSWVIYFKLVNAGEASKVASFTFIVPLISVLIGTLILHEPFTFYLVLGIVLIVTSICLVNRQSSAGRVPRNTRNSGVSPFLE